MNVILFAVDIYTDLLTQKALSSLLNLRLSVKEITVMPNTAYLRYLCTYTYFHVPITSFHYIFFFNVQGYAGGILFYCILLKAEVRHLHLFLMIAVVAIGFNSAEALYESR